MQYSPALAQTPFLRRPFALCFADDFLIPKTPWYSTSIGPLRRNPCVKTPWYMQNGILVQDTPSAWSSQSNQVNNHINRAAMVPMINFIIFDDCITITGLCVAFLMNNPSRLDTWYSVMYWTSHSRTLGSACPVYSSTISSTFHPATWRTTATAQPVRCCRMD